MDRRHDDANIRSYCVTVRRLRLVLSLCRVIGRPYSFTVRYFSRRFGHWKARLLLPKS